MTEEILRPNGDVNTGDWFCSTGANFYALVDEVDLDLGDFVYTATGYRYLALAHSATSGQTINKVTVHAVMAMAAGTANNRLCVKVGAAIYQGADHLVDAVASEYTQEWTVNPATLAPWTSAEIDDMGAGVYSRNLAGGTLEVYQIWVTVEYDD